MTQEIAKKPALALDSIDAFDDTVEGEDGSSGGGFLPDGTRIKFTKTELWVTTKGGEDISGKVLVHLDTLRTEVEWGKDGKPVGPPKILAPGEQYRDIEAANELIPKDRWRPGYDPGSLRGPLENQNVVLLADMATMDRLVWPSPTTTIGAAICVRELNERVQRMRKYRGLQVYAKVKLTKTMFSKRYNLQRPHMEIVGFVTPTENGLVEVDTDALPSVQQIPAPTVTPAQHTTPPWRDVAELTRAEEIKGKIRF